MQTHTRRKAAAPIFGNEPVYACLGNVADEALDEATRSASRRPKEPAGRTGGSQLVRCCPQLAIVKINDQLPVPLARANAKIEALVASSGNHQRGLPEGLSAWPPRHAKRASDLGADNTHIAVQAAQIR